MSLLGGSDDVGGDGCGDNVMVIIVMIHGCMYVCIYVYTQYNTHER